MARPSECVVREGGNIRTSPGARRTLLPSGRSAAACVLPAESGEKRIMLAEVGVQVSDVQVRDFHDKAGTGRSGGDDDGGGDAMHHHTSCLLCGRKAVCLMADLNEEDKRQIAQVLQQVLELSELNDTVNGQLEAERQMREEAVAKTIALVEEVDGLRGKLAHALDLLRAYQKRVREMQQALITSDQALSSLQYEHKALLVRIPGSRSAPPTPPPKAAAAEPAVGDLSAAVESIAASLVHNQELLHTPRAATGSADAAGYKALPDPGTQENTPAPQPAPTAHCLDAASSALQVAAAVAGGPAAQPALLAGQQAAQSQAFVLRQRVAATIATRAGHVAGQVIAESTKPSNPSAMTATTVVVNTADVYRQSAAIPESTRSGAVLQSAPVTVVTLSQPSAMQCGQAPAPAAAGHLQGSNVASSVAVQQALGPHHIEQQHILESLSSVQPAIPARPINGNGHSLMQPAKDSTTCNVAQSDGKLTEPGVPRRRCLAFEVCERVRV